MANRSRILSLFPVGIRNFQTALAGSNRIRISEMMLKRQVIRMLVLLSRHRALMISGFQRASLGEQAKMVRKVLII